ncbi:hypothetical protein LZ31DRAFT_106574 [Colletotrichum somersetense]|nr:hypothetical protein LZ31DRAFT_106574 [Colletotrichum somersetense]
MTRGPDTYPTSSLPCISFRPHAPVHCQSSPSPDGGGESSTCAHCHRPGPCEAERHLNPGPRLSVRLSVCPSIRPNDRFVVFFLSICLYFLSSTRALPSWLRHGQGSSNPFTVCSKPMLLRLASPFPSRYMPYHAYLPTYLTYPVGTPWPCLSSHSYIFHPASTPPCACFAQQQPPPSKYKEPSCPLTSDTSSTSPYSLRQLACHACHLFSFLPSVQLRTFETEFLQAQPIHPYPSLITTPYTNRTTEEHSTRLPGPARPRTTSHILSLSPRHLLHKRTHIISPRPIPILFYTHLPGILTAVPQQLVLDYAFSPL